MSISALIRKSADHGVLLYLEGDNLKFKLTVKLFPAELKKEILINKPEIIDFLTFQSNGTDVPITDIPVLTERKNLLASFAQQRLWFIDKLRGGSSEYNMPIAFNVVGQLDLSILNRVFNTIVERHEVLRTVLIERGDTLEQDIRSKQQYSFKVNVIDLTEYLEATQNQLIEKLVQEDSTKPFNLAKDLMLRVSYLKTAKASGVLLFNMHHIASDGWSMQVLTKEFLSLYTAYSANEAPSLEKLEVQYADYAHWQRSRLSDKQFESQIDYWKETLLDIEPLHLLPLKRTRPEQKGSRGKIVKGNIPLQINERLSALALQHRLTPFMLFHGALSLVLSKYSNSYDVVIGTANANRLSNQLSPLIGFFVNTIVLRLNTKNRLLNEYLQDIREVHLGAQVNQDVPFDKIVESLQVPRSNSYTPLTQIMMTMQSDFTGDKKTTGLKELSLPNVSLTPLFSKETNTKFDLEIDFKLTSSEMVINWTYDVDLFSESFICQLNKSLENILLSLSEIAHESDICINDIPFLSSNESEYLITGMNQSFTDYPREQCIHTLFESMVQQSPDAIAAVFQERKISYGELNQKANQLSHYLIEHHKITPDSLVGVGIERSIELIIAVLAILKAGGAYVPLDPKYPADTLKYLLEDSQVTVILTQKHIDGVLKDCNRKKVFIDDILIDADGHEYSHYPQNNPAGYFGSTKSSNLAYMIYTSGTTAKPKGVMVEHKSLVNTVLDNSATFNISPDSVIYQATSFNFDAATWVMFMALTRGAQIRFASSIDFVADFEKYQDVTHLMMTPSMLQGINPETLPKLQNIIVGGEVCSPSLLDTWNLPDISFFNAYGPTETAICSTIAKIGKNERISLGKRISNTQLFILGQEQELLPFGAKGELYIGGVGLARGYLNLDELTRQCFIHSPYYRASDPNSSSHLYRTGDIVRYCEDGQLEYIGRTDEQVKVRGFRVEISAIESQLNEFDILDSSVVIAVNHADSTHLIAYIKPSLAEPVSNQKEFLDQVSRQLEEVLPHYMVPSYFILVDQWLLTSNGKIDKKQLPAFEYSQLKCEFVEASSETEVLLRDLYSDLLSIPAEEISVSANFFELGGHSLKATQLVNRVRADLNKELPLQQLFKLDSLSDIATYIDSQEEQQVNDFIGKSDEDRSLPSFSQQRLWFIDKLQGQSSEYNMPVVFDVTGALNLDVLNRVFNTIIERHEVLRTAFLESNGRLLQKIKPVGQFEFKTNVFDASKRPREERLFAIDQFIQKEAGRSFNLADDLMLRAHYVKVSGGTGVLLVNIHHIASDGWSMQVLTKEFNALYTAFINGEQNPLAPLEIQFSDYASWQRHYLLGKQMSLQLSYWQEMLKDAPLVHSLPLSKSRGGNRTHCASTIYSNVDKEVSDRLGKFHRNNGLTPFMLFHGALSFLLAKHSDSSDIIIGTPVAGRNQPQLAPLIGFFVNTLVLRANTQNSSLDDYFSHIRQVNVDAQLNQDLPYDKLIELLQIPRSNDYSPLVQIMMSVQSDFIGNEVEANNILLPDVSMAPIASEQASTKFDIQINIEHSEESTSIQWIYDNDLFTYSQIEHLSNNFTTLLSSLSQVEDSASVELKDIQILSDTTCKKLLTGFNVKDVAYPRDKSIQTLFEEQVKINPDHIALVYSDSKYTYRQLNDRANRLANYLKEKYQIGEAALIGLCTHRSLEMVVGILAILKAGGAYLPLDPASPKQRVKYIIEDANVSLILCQESTKTLLVDNCENLFLLDDVSESVIKDHPCYQSSSANFSLTSGKPNDLAYVMYTSGSTGKPKGVLIEHLGIIRLARGLGFTTFSQNPTTLQLANIAFDGSTFELWGALLNGGTCVLYTDEFVSPELINNHIQQYGIDVLLLTAWVFTEWTFDLPLNTKLKLVLAGGDEHNADSIARFQQTLPQVEFVNSYGPTENTTFTACHLFKKTFKGEPIPIGQGLDGDSLLVLDSELNLVPEGAHGELFVGGDGLARGYLNNSELTSQSFIKNPFLGALNVPMPDIIYRTGDIVRYLPNGKLHFLGRKDVQVKIRGFRVELGEIEQFLHGLDFIDSSIVILNESANNKELVGCVKLSKSCELSSHITIVRKIKQLMADKLPYYMIPTKFSIVDVWPLTSNEKIDKKQLQKTEIVQLQGKLVQVSTITEIVLSEIFADLLGLESSGISSTANFFELGGHSLLAVQLVSRVNKELHRDLPLTQLFKLDSLSDVANYIDNQQEQQALPQKLASAPLEYLPAGDPFDTYYPVTVIQKKMLTHHMSGNGVYHPVIYFELCSIDLKLDVLELVLKYLLSKHVVFGTRFHIKENGEFVQSIDREVSFEIDVEDISGVENLQHHINQLMDREVNEKFEFGELCFRFRVLQHSARSWGIVFSTHHAITDGWGFSRFLAELSVLYKECQQGKVLPLIKRDFPTVLEHVALELEAKSDSAHRLAWEKLLTDYQPMPPLSAMNSNKSRKFITQTVNFYEIELNALKSKSLKYRVDIKSLILNAYFCSLSEVLNSDVVTVDVVSNGRSSRLNDPLNAMGLFWVFLPIVHQVSDIEGNDLKLLSDRVWKSNEHSLYPYDCIESLINRPQSELTYVSFNFVNFYSAATNSPDFDVSQRYISDRFHHEIQLAVSVNEKLNNMSLQLTFNANVFEEERAMRLLTGIQDTLTVF